MPDCRKCGAELDKYIKYCPACGTSVSENEGVDRSDLLLVFGSITLLAAFGLLVAGGALLAVNMGLTDSEGFITSKSQRLERDSYAIVFQHIHINLGEAVGEWAVWSPSPSDFITIKLTGSSNGPSKNIFIGIAEESSVEAYLSDVWYDEVTHLSFSSSRSLSLEYSTHSGDAVPSDPTSQTFWEVSVHGTGTQTLEWKPETGSYWIVLMNEDGAARMDLTVSMGVKIPLLSTIHLVLFAGGIIALTIGSTLVYSGVRK